MAKHLRQCSEPELIQRALESPGETKEAIDILFSRYRGRVLNAVARWGGPEDIVQDAFISAWIAFPSFDPKRGGFGGWLYTILRNKFIDYCKDARNILPEYTEGMDEIPAPIKPFVELQGWEFWLVIRDCLDGLPDKYREAVHLRIMENCTYREIAEYMELDYGAAYMNVQRGLKILREALMGRPDVVDLLGNLSHRKQRAIVDGGAA